jgi:hypothetical protein
MGDDFTPFTAEEREDLVTAAFGSDLGQRLQAHLLARAALGELDVDQEEINRGITESPDAGRAMGDEAFMELPEERRDVLRHAVWAMVINAMNQSVRQFEHACNQLKIDPRFDEVGPDVIAMFAATPAVLGGVLFKLEDDPDQLVSFK